MSAHIDRFYKVKTFYTGQLYNLALELINHIGTDISKCDFRVSYTVDDIRIVDNISLNQLSEIKEVGGKLDFVALDINQESLTFLECCGNIRVIFSLSLGLEEAKVILALTERIMELQRIEKPYLVDKVYSDNNDYKEYDFDSVTSGERVETWEKALKMIRIQVERNSFYTWIFPVSASLQGNDLYLLSPNEFAADWLKSRYYSLICSTVKSIDPSIQEIIIRH